LVGHFRQHQELPDGQPGFPLTGNHGLFLLIGYRIMPKIVPWGNHHERGSSMFEQNQQNINEYDDHECLIFVKGRMLSFESVDSAIDALTLGGVIRTGNTPLEDISNFAESIRALP
jgi:hypothetical protein